MSKSIIYDRYFPIIAEARQAASPQERSRVLSMVNGVPPVFKDNLEAEVRLAFEERDRRAANGILKLKKKPESVIFGNELEGIDFSVPEPVKEDPFKRDSLIPPASTVTALLDKSLPPKQDSLSLLYLIAEDRNKMVDAIHHGVSCNYCGMSPITGPRYHCSNCADLDLCEACELAGKHDKYHILIKIKVPIPLMKSPRWRWKSFYPVRALVRDFDVPEELDQEQLKDLSIELKEYQSYVEQLYELFRQMIDYRVKREGEYIYGATRRSFCDLYLPSKPSQRFQDMFFRVYDMDRDGILTFPEFIRTHHLLTNSPNYRVIQRLFRTWDADGDGYLQKFDMKTNIKLILEYWQSMLPLPDAALINKDFHDRIWEGRRPLSSLFPNISDEPFVSDNLDEFSPDASIIFNGKPFYDFFIEKQNIPRDLAARYGIRNASFLDSIDSSVEYLVHQLVKDIGFGDLPFIEIDALDYEHSNLLIEVGYGPLLVDWLRSLAF